MCTPCLIFFLWGKPLRVIWILYWIPSKILAFWSKQYHLELMLHIHIYKIPCQRPSYFARLKNTCSIIDPLAMQRAQNSYQWNCNEWKSRNCNELSARNQTKFQVFFADQINPPSCFSCQSDSVQFSACRSQGIGMEKILTIKQT